MHEFQSEVFMIIGGCTKDEKFVAEVTCLDPLRRSRLEVAKLPITEQETENENKKWVEFACITLKNEVYISGKEHDIGSGRGELRVLTFISSFFTRMLEAIWVELSTTGIPNALALNQLQKVLDVWGYCLALALANGDITCQSQMKPTFQTHSVALNIPFAGPHPGSFRRHI